MKNKLEIKKINILSLAKIVALIDAVVGFIIGILISIAIWRLQIIGGSIRELSSITPGIGSALSLLKFAFLIYPIYYGILGFVGGLIIALLYNWLASWLGGITIETK